MAIMCAIVAAIAVLPSAAAFTRPLPVLPVLRKHPAQSSRVAVACVEQPSNSKQPSPLTVSPDSIVLLGIAGSIAYVHPIPFADLAFAVAYPCYLAVMNQWRFGGNSVGADREFVPLLREGRGEWFKQYVLSFALAGLLVPLPVVFGCFIFELVPSAVSAAAAPHLLLTMVQCACEALTRSPSVHALVRLLIPIGFNAYRMGVLFKWSRAAFDLWQAKPWYVIQPWYALGLSLALTNLVMWTYNLFVFLLWRTTPQYLDPTEFPTPPTEWNGLNLIPSV